MSENARIPGGVACRVCGGESQRYTHPAGKKLKAGECTHWDFCYSCGTRTEFFDGTDYQTGVGKGEKYVRALDGAPCTRDFAYAESEAWKASVGGLGVPRAFRIGAAPCPRCGSRNQFRYRPAWTGSKYGYLQHWVHCKQCARAIGLEVDHVYGNPPETPKTPAETPEPIDL